MTLAIDSAQAAEYVAKLRSKRQALVDAAVADGWPAAMAVAGFDGHFQTWDIDGLARSLAREVALIEKSPHLHWVAPKKVHHLWPALPGAGLAPVLAGLLLGLPQAVRPSSRGSHLAAQLAHGAPWELLGPKDCWEAADTVVISGGDDTVAAVSDAVAATTKVVGYGHRVSLAVVDDGDGQADLQAAASELAKDVVMWHQRGCFSVRAILFCGGDKRRRQFCVDLAAAIGRCEQLWAADAPGEADLAARAQALGLAQMRGEIFCEGLGYVRFEAAPFDGAKEAVHSVTVHPVAGPADVADAVALERDSIQGVAMAGGWRKRREKWIAALGSLGATRIAAAGTMQAPPAQWWHDGQPNGLCLGRVVTVDGGGA